MSIQLCRNNFFQTVRDETTTAMKVKPSNTADCHRTARQRQQGRHKTKAAANVLPFDCAASGQSGVRHTSPGGHARRRVED